MSRRMTEAERQFKYLKKSIEKNGKQIREIKEELIKTNNNTTEIRAIKEELTKLNNNTNTNFQNIPIFNYQPEQTVGENYQPSEVVEDQYQQNGEQKDDCPYGNI